MSPASPGTSQPAQRWERLVARDPVAGQGQPFPFLSWWAVICAVGNRRRTGRPPAVRYGGGFGPGNLPNLCRRVQHLGFHVECPNGRLSGREIEAPARFEQVEQRARWWLTTM